MLAHSPDAASSCANLALLSLLFPETQYSISPPLPPLKDGLIKMNENVLVKICDVFGAKKGECNVLLKRPLLDLAGRRLRVLRSSNG